MTEWIMTSCVVITAILAIRFCFKERIGARLRYALWLVVLIRLLLPVQIGESAISAAQLDRELPRISAQIQETLVREWKYRDFEPDLKEALIARDKEEYDPYYTFSEHLAYRADDITAALRVIWYSGMAFLFCTGTILWCGLRQNCQGKTVSPHVMRLRSGILARENGMHMAEPCFRLPIRAERKWWL